MPDDLSPPDARPTPYAMLGGEAGVRALADAFYDRLELDEAFAIVRRLYPARLEDSRDKLFWFLAGWLGGPQHYVERFGHPRLRARHLPYPIASAERDAWLLCMRAALDDVNAPAALVDPLMEAFRGTADWMRNREG